jgi:hypothetical protein
MGYQWSLASIFWSGRLRGNDLPQRERCPPIPNNVISQWLTYTCVAPRSCKSGPQVQIGPMLCMAVSAARADRRETRAPAFHRLLPLGVAALQQLSPSHQRCASLSGLLRKAQRLGR